MKKALIAITVLSVLAGFSGLAQASAEKGYIAVNTSANTEIAPDVCELSFAVKTYDTKSMQKATQINKEISDKVFNELKSMINTENGDYIKTSDFSAQPLYSYSSSKKIFDKYEVSNRVIIHTKSIDKVGKMIDNAIQAGATNVDSLSFSVSNYESQCNDLIVKAAEKAHTRASVSAKALNSSLDGIRSFDTSCSANNYNTPRFYMAKNMIAEASCDDSTSAGSATSISNGVVKIYANVNASFFVK